VKKRQFILAGIGLLAVAVVVLAIIAWPEREPEYHGKKLSEWLVLCGVQPKPPDRYEAPQMVRQIGPKAVPTLLKWLHYRRPAWKSKAYIYFCKLPPSLQIKFVAQQLAPPQKDYENLALLGFWILHEEAASAVPDLARMMQDTRQPGGSALAMRCLFCIGDAGLPALRLAAHGPDPTLRATLTNTLLNGRLEFWNRIVAPPDAEPSRARAL
jgi:hypothetical protein